MSPIYNAFSSAKSRFFPRLFQGLILVVCCAFTDQAIGADFSAYDLINAVNQIRTSRGIPEVHINSILMNVAQSHSEYQAANRRSSHSGIYGEIVNERVAAAGYGAGGKIVAGENVANLDNSVTGMLPIIVYEIWSDAGHWGTMVNPKYQDIGVGIASDEKSVYVTLNLGGVVSEKATPQVTQAAGTQPQPIQGGQVPAILPLLTSTPMQDGAVYHFVGYGQTLSTIARIYQVDIKELVRLNQIDPDKIYTGQKLLIKTAGTIPSTETAQATNLPTITATLELTPTLTISPTILPAKTLPAMETKEIGIYLIYILFGVICVFILFYLQKLQSRPK